MDMIQLRPVRWPADRAALLALDTAFVTERIYQVQGDEWSLALAETVVAPLHKAFPLADELADAQDAWAHMVVADAAGTVVGFAAAQHHAWNRRTTLGHLYVAPERRGQGVGRLLLDSALRYARSTGSRALWAEVTNVNYPAVQFYRRMGFRLCGFDRTLYDPEGPTAGEFALFLAHDLRPR